MNLWNLYERSAGETEVMWGLKGRLWRGGSKYEDGPDCDAGAPADWERTSVVLALVQGGEVRASVELRLQPTDGKIPFTHPGLDRIGERQQVEHQYFRSLLF